MNPATDRSAAMMVNPKAKRILSAHIFRALNWQRISRIGMVRRVFQVSLRNKIIGLVIVLLIFFGLFVMSQFIQQTTVLLEEQLDLQAVSTAQYIANRSMDYIYQDDQFSLYALVRDAKQSNKNIRYILIVDRHGDLLVDTFGGRLPKGLLEVNHPSMAKEGHLQIIATEEGLVRDWIVPILEGDPGFVRIGMSEVSLLNARLEIMERMAIATALFILLGIVTAFLLTNLIAYPFRNLVRGTEEIAAGNLVYRVPPPLMEDEGGRLILAFNEMVDKLERSTAEIQELNTLRQGFLEKLLKTQEEERARLSRELHDETSQLLASLRMALRYLEESPNLETAQIRLNGLRQLLDETFEGFRRFVAVLRPSSLEEGDLRGSLEHYAAEFERRFAIKVDLAFSGSSAELTAESAIALFRIVQESLTNVARHAKAHHVSIVLSVNSGAQSQFGEQTLVIEDDGIGFDVEETLSRRAEKGSLGIFGIQERVRLLGGSCQVESTPGQGTALYVRIPREARGNE